jgi:hypothetical protein
MGLKNYYLLLLAVFYYARVLTSSLNVFFAYALDVNGLNSQLESTYLLSVDTLHETGCSINNTLNLYKPINTLIKY